jgi:hypothetical protein
MSSLSGARGGVEGVALARRPRCQTPEALAGAAVLWRYIDTHRERFPVTRHRPDGSPWPADLVDGRSGLGPVAGEVAMLEEVARRELAAAGFHPESVRLALAKVGLIRRGEGANLLRKVALLREGVPGTNGAQPRMLQLLPHD